MVDEFLAERPRLYGLAYRMLASHSQAEDVLQEAYLRWSQNAGEVRHARAYLTRVVSHLCLDYLRSAAHRRETYPGTWLPEPIASGPEEGVIQQESVRFAFLRLLQELNPRERAAYLLREVLDHDYTEIAEWLGETPTNVRQLVSRAGKRLAEGRPRFEAEPRRLEELLANFLRGVSEGDLESLKRVLHRDVVVWSDGGGKARAAVNPIHGPDKVARFFLGIARKAGGMASRPVWLNGLPGLLVDDEWGLRAALFEFEGDELAKIYVVSNPDKVGHLSRAF